MSVVATIGLAVILSSPSLAVSGGYALHTITGLSNQAQTEALGISSKNVIVGSDGETQAYPPCQGGADAAFSRTTRKVITEFQAPTACYTLAESINKSGTIAGYFAPSDNQIQGFILMADGSYTNVVYPGAYYTRFYAINDGGNAAGNYYNGEFHGIIDQLGTVSSYDVPAALDATGTAIFGLNNNGDTGGLYYTGSTNYGWTLIDGTFATINYPGAQATEVDGINDADDAVGSYTDSADVQHGFIMTPGGTFSSIDVRGATSTLIHGINDKGDLVGAYVLKGTTYAAYLTPR